MPTNDDITVLVPTYRRPGELVQCLQALSRQTVRPRQVVVISRDIDVESQRRAQEFHDELPLVVVRVDRPGQVQALNCGLVAATTRYVAITDDDSRPREDWLQRILAHFDDPSVGAVGGRDIVHAHTGIAEGHEHEVGRIKWFGRVIGNHHLAGTLQTVHFLKGVNMSYRRHLLVGFDENLAGSGSQICNDLQASLRVHTMGWRVVWDPRVAVDHYPAPRFDEDARTEPALHAVANIWHNQTYILLSLLTGWRRWVTLAWALSVGTGDSPGPVMVPRSLVKTRSVGRVWFGLQANTMGRFAGVKTYLRTGGTPTYPQELKAECTPYTEHS